MAHKNEVKKDQVVNWMIINWLKRDRVNRNCWLYFSTTFQGGRDVPKITLQKQGHFTILICKMQHRRRRQPFLRSSTSSHSSSKPVLPGSALIKTPTMCTSYLTRCIIPRFTARLSVETNTWFYLDTSAKLYKCGTRKHRIPNITSPPGIFLVRRFTQTSGAWKTEYRWTNSLLLSKLVRSKTHPYLMFEII